MSLKNKGLATLRAPERFRLIDLRDPALTDLGLERLQLVSTTAAHYPCTRQWAKALHSRKIGSVKPAGLLWNSRVAELAKVGSPLLADLLPGAPEEVVVLFGNQLTTTDSAAYQLLVEADDLSSVGALPLVNLIAAQLGATRP
jgi:hypothetical protein